MKKCTKCKIEKELEEFSKCKSRKDGLRYQCKSCRKEYRKEYCKANADKIREQKKEYHKANADKINKQTKEWYKANPEKRKEYNKEYRKANAYKIRERNVEYSKEKRKTDPLFKFTHNTRCLIRDSFKRGINNFAKSKRTEEILGCSVMFFQTYIKGQFKKGMTLDNHGEWHLDHIKPIASAQTKEEIIVLNHYTNFQPLWAKDNLSKSNKIIEKQLKLL